MGGRERQGRRGLARHERRVNSATFGPDGSRIITASDDETACSGMLAPARKSQSCVDMKAW
ncbi:MAG: hypothetical protein ACJ8EU_04760 [Xanthobacteraceae bacterium]